MPVREIKTTIALDGEQQFKKALADATREMRVMDSELKAVTEAYRANGDGAEYFAAKQRNLRSQISQQEQIIKGLEQAVEEAGRAYGESSSQVDGYTIALNNARAKMSKLEKQLSDTDREIEELGRDSIKAGRQLEKGIGDSAEEAEKDVRSLVETIQDDLSAIRSNTAFTAVSSLWNMASGAYTSVAGFVEGTVEYRRQLSFLKQNAETNGFDFSLIESQLYEVQALTGDTSSSIEGMSNLMATGFDDGRLTDAVDLLAGAVISFPETIKFETLADSLQETIATGSATGQFAELLGRLGYNVEDFNTALEESPTAAGDLDIALAHLAAAGMKDVYDQWQKNNEAMQNAGRVQAELEGELAKFGGKLEGYIVTPVKELLVDALKYVNDTVEYAEENGLKSAGSKLLDDAKTPVATALEWDASTIGSSAETNRRILENELSMRNALLEAAGKIWRGITNAPLDVMDMPTVKADIVTRTMEEILSGIDMDAYYNWIDQQRKEAEGQKKSLIDILIPTAYAEEKGAEAGQAFVGGMEEEITVDLSDAKLVESALPTISPVQTQEEIEAAMRDIEATVTSYEDDMEEAGEEAGDAMTDGFATAWRTLDNKAYMAGASMARSYADGVNSQLGVISAAASRLSVAAASALATARAGASRAVVLNLDGRKVAEGIAPYSDEVMATYLNFD